MTQLSDEEARAKIQDVIVNLEKFIQNVSLANTFQDGLHTRDFAPLAAALEPIVFFLKESLK